jgi:hypothetical protein
MGEGEERTLPVVHGLMAGAVAGLISRAVVYPADTLKSQLQLRSALPSLHPAASTSTPTRTTARPSTLAAFAQVRTRPTTANCITLQTLRWRLCGR